MTFDELKELFRAYTNVEDAEEAQLALWFNEAQLDLAYDLGKGQSWELEAVGGDSYDLPPDCLRILDCTTDYHITPTGQITFDQGGAATVYYIQTPTPFTGVDQDQESELHQALHSLLAIFAASRYWDQESEGDTEESNHATKWMSYYFQGKNLAKSRLQTVGVQLDRWRIE